VPKVNRHFSRSTAAALAAVLLSLVPIHAQQHSRLFPPTELGMLEGPDRESYQRPEQIMDSLYIGEGSVVADVGAGGGWFTVRLARRVGPNGTVYAEDVQQLMIQAIEGRVRGEGLRNVKLVLGTSLDPRLPERALDAILIVDAYHEMEQPIAMLRNLAKTLKPAGLIGILEFKKDGFGPGPDAMEERIDPERVIRDAQAAGLQLKRRENFLRYQHLLIFGLPSR
jgi:ubiquinone/menaquinone biosynthesis C-methylase UbiE